MSVLRLSSIVFGLSSAMTLCFGEFHFVRALGNAPGIIRGGLTERSYKPLWQAVEVVWIWKMCLNMVTRGLLPPSVLTYKLTSRRPWGKRTKPGLEPQVVA